MKGKSYKLGGQVIMLHTLVLEKFSLEFWNGDYTNFHHNVLLLPSTGLSTLQYSLNYQYNIILRSTDSRARLLEFIFYSAKASFMTLGKSLNFFCALVLKMSMKSNNRTYLIELL